MKHFLSLILLSILFISCGVVSEEDDDDSGSGSIPDEMVKEVDVFGISVLGTSSVSDAQMLHVATVLAEYLDNDEDGTADSSDVISALSDSDAYMVVFADEDELGEFEDDFGDWPGNGDGIITVLADEVVQSTDYQNDGFDPAIEEVLHMVTSKGFAEAYPDVFGEEQGSDIADAMDTARGGYYADIPSSYPSGAWYTYDDDSCDYSCQITEYTYWLLTSHLGIQDYTGRDSEISSEWTKNTAALVQSDDTAGYAIVSSTEYGLPTTAPDLTYNGSTLSVESR